MSIYTKGVFWIATFERAVKTSAQMVAAVYFTDLTGDILVFDWPTAGGLAGFAALASIVTSVASAPAGSGQTPSLVDE